MDWCALTEFLLDVACRPFVYRVITEVGQVLNQPMCQCRLLDLGPALPLT